MEIIQKAVKKWGMYFIKLPLKKHIIILVILGIITIAAIFYFRSCNGKDLSYNTVPVKRGELLVSISSTGTVEPEEVVNVGAQVAGRILSFGQDVNGKTIDYGSIVEEGTILAQIDDSLYSAEAKQTAAELESSQAAIQSAEANLELMEAKLYQTQRDWERAQKLGPSEVLSQTSYDSYQSAFEMAKANVNVAKASILQAKANLDRAEAVQIRAQRNLEYCTIKSPVKGIIIDRRVNIGQTVVASLNAPSLFLIARDLKRMQVWVAVNEADIGKIFPGQPATFTVDAFPGEIFTGCVGKIRLNASMTQNVVTYTVEIITDNSNGKLLPYLTANVEFELGRRDNVLMVANASLKWMPQPEQVASEFRDTFQKLSGKMTPMNGGRGRRQSGPSVPKQKAGKGKMSGIVWALQQNKRVRPIQVRVGLSNGLMTEIEGEGIAEGQEIVVGQQSQINPSSDATNPFAPRIPRGSGSGARLRSAM